MSEPAIAVNQEGLRRRRGEIEKSPDEMERAQSYPAQPGLAPANPNGPLPPVTLWLLSPLVLGCPWLNVAAGFLWLSRVLGPSGVHSLTP